MEPEAVMYGPTQETPNLLTENLTVSTVSLQPMEIEELESFVAQDVPSANLEAGLCGLYNLGNTCYMNSALQCLLHDEALKEHFIYDMKNVRLGEGLLSEFTELYKKYWNGKWASIVPREFKKHLGITHSQFEGRGQHDGQEFLALFLSSLQQEFKKQNQQCPFENTQENNTCRTPLVEEKNMTRKRAGDNVNDSMPNNKRMDSTPLRSKQYLTLTSFIGKEKKTANINVLSSEVECDEEITTDHSNKFPQVTGFIPNAEEGMSGGEANNQMLLQKKPLDGGANFIEQIKDLNLKQFKESNSKQTNLIADIKRHAEKEIGWENEDATCSDSLCKASRDSGDCLDGLLSVSNTVLLSSMQTALTPLNETATVYADSVQNKSVLVNNLDELDPSKDVDASLASTIRIEDAKVSVECATSHVESDQIALKKIFSLKKTTVPRIHYKLQEGLDEENASCSSHSNPTYAWNENTTCSNNVPSNCHAGGDATCNLFPTSIQNGPLVTKFNNILEESRVQQEREESTDFDNSEELESIDDSQENASNIRGDICGNSIDFNHCNTADTLWRAYTEKHNSIIVDTFQGQLESTVTCCKCSHKSTTYEPFMYLSVPIPHALQSCFDIFLSPLDGEPSHHSVYVPKHGRVQDLRDALASKLATESIVVDLALYSFCEVQSSSILKVLESTMLLKSINTATRCLQAIEVVNCTSSTAAQEVSNDNSWNSCCICLEDLSDNELLRHNANSCSILICHNCLQTSTDHYGLDNFSCPVCHMSCSPANDFVQLASTSQNREVLVSVSFHHRNHEDTKSLASPRLLRLSTTLPYEDLMLAMNQIIPSQLLCLGEFQVFFSSLDGRFCSRCDVTNPCTGCTTVTTGTGDVTLQPGDNLSVRFQQEPGPETFPLSTHLYQSRDTRDTTITLEKCLEAFTKNEVLDDSNPWFCPTCGCHQVAEKRLRVCRWPNTLIVYIKRFLYHSQTAVKVDDEVIFPSEDFNPGFTSGSDPHHAKLYDLNSCVSHYGGIFSGHYTSYCRHPTSRRWHLYNDDVVEEHEPSAKDSSGAYVLFYKEKIPGVQKNRLHD